jgi:hypothetical protein
MRKNSAKTVRCVFLFRGRCPRLKYYALTGLGFLYSPIWELFYLLPKTGLLFACLFVDVSTVKVLRPYRAWFRYSPIWELFYLLPKTGLLFACLFVDISHG